MKKTQLKLEKFSGYDFQVKLLYILEVAKLTN